MTQEVQVSLDVFSLRWYQEEIFDLIDTGKTKKLFYVASRRAGKDILFWNLLIRQCLKRVCLCFHVLPTYKLGRGAIFDAITIEQIKFIDFLPMTLVESINQAEMKIRFKNGSILRVIGGETWETSIVGTNPYAIVLSEYQGMSPEIIPIIRPILAANRGWLAVLGTPRGKNHFWHLYNIAKEITDDWKVFVHKASEIQHIPAHILAKERAQMDEGMYLQEYECSFERGISGSWYGTQLDTLKLKGQIGYVPWEPGLLVYTAWDIGVNDPTTIIFFNVVGDGSVVRIIDCYSNTGVGIDHYAKILQDKPYKYAKHFAPMDIKVREWGGGAVTRYEKARQLGIEFTLVEQVGVIDGIENVWTHFNKFWIDEQKCRSLIDALENYRKEWDDKRNMYLPKPVKSWATHYADALRYLCMSLHKTQRGLTPEEFERKKYEALYGNSSQLPRFFNDDPRYNNYR